MKERFQDVIKSFFVSTVLINVAMFVCGMAFKPQQMFGYEVMLYPLLYGFLASIPNFFLYAKKERSVKQTIRHEILQIILIILIIELFMFAGKPMTEELVCVAAGVAVSIAVVFIAVKGILYCLDLKTARRMTEQLKQFQERVRE